MTNYENKSRQLKKLHRDPMLDNFYVLGCSCGTCGCNCNCSSQSSTVMGNNQRGPASSVTSGYFNTYTAMVTG